MGLAAMAPEEPAAVPPDADTAAAARRLARQAASLRAARAALQAREERVREREGAAAAAVRETVAALLERLSEAGRSGAADNGAEVDAAVLPQADQEAACRAVARSDSGTSGEGEFSGAGAFAALAASLRQSSEQLRVHLLGPQHSAAAAATQQASARCAPSRLGQRCTTATARAQRR
jgi:hypothetical protein